jgi:hypothetical protein
VVLITSKTFIYPVYLLCVSPLVQVVHVLFVVREYYPRVYHLSLCVGLRGFFGEWSQLGV